jgi:hypothetical protein
LFDAHVMFDDVEVHSCGGLVGSQRTVTFA